MPGAVRGRCTWSPPLRTSSPRWTAMASWFDRGLGLPTNLSLQASSRWKLSKLDLKVSVNERVGKRFQGDQTEGREATRWYFCRWCVFGFQLCSFKISDFVKPGSFAFIENDSSHSVRYYTARLDGCVFITVKRVRTDHSKHVI